MKKLVALMFVLMLGMSTSVFAQSASVSQGNIELGIGNLFSYSRAWNDSFTFNHYRIGTIGKSTEAPLEFGIVFPTPAFDLGVFLFDGLLLGVMGGYDNLSEKDSNDPVEQWFVGPELKYYLALTDSVLIDLHGAFTYNALKGFDGDQTIEQNHLMIGAAFNYCITKNFAISLGLDYTRYFKVKVDDEEVDNSEYDSIAVALGLKAFVSFSD